MIEFLKSIIPIRVWTLSHEDLGNGYTVNKRNLVDFATEIFVDFEDCNMKKEIKLLIDQFINRCGWMEPGDTQTFGKWKIKCGWTTQRTLDKYPEFEGW